MKLIENWIRNSSHSPWCEEADGNIYSSGGDCNCGRVDVLDAMKSSYLNAFKDGMKHAASICDGHEDWMPADN